MNIKEKKKKYLLLFAFFISISIICFFIFLDIFERVKNDYYRLPVTEILNIASVIKPCLLNKDRLCLENEIKKISNINGFISAWIQNRENEVEAIYNKSQYNSHPNSNEKFIDKYKKVKIEKTIDNDKRILIYSLDLFYEKFERFNIGKIYLIQSAPDFFKTVTNYYIYISIIESLCFVLFFVCYKKIKSTSHRKSSAEDQKYSGNEDRIGPYVILKKIGTGGMAEVFIAEHTGEGGFQKIVAVKKILSYLVDSPDAKDFINMFKREARIAAKLHHNNIVQVTDFRQENSSYYIIMEYMHGKSLDSIMKKVRTGLSIDAATFIVSEICKGLHYSYTKKDEFSRQPLKIIHRDISPQNILISFQGVVKISDYGIAKAMSETNLANSIPLKGKFSYMSPEQLMRKTVDQRTDLYSLGIIFYEILHGDRLNKFRSEIEASESINKRVTPIKELRHEVPDGLDRIVMRCLNKNKRQRYQSADNLLNDLKEFKKQYNHTFGVDDLSSFMKDHFKEDISYNPILENHKEEQSYSVGHY